MVDTACKWHDSFNDGHNYKWQFIKIRETTANGGAFYWRNSSLYVFILNFI